MTWSVLSAKEQASFVQRIRDGEPAAEEAFVRLFGERIRVMLLARTRDAEAARELTQDVVMLAAWRAIREGQLRDPERLAAFVHGTARNIVNSYLRARAGEPRFEPVSDDAEQLPAYDHRPAAERRTLVEDALPRLAPADREVLLLTLVRGLQPREIAASLGLSVEVVRARKSRAVKRVIDAIAGALRMTGKRD